MLTAIFVIFVMASVSSLIMNVTGKTIKTTMQQYQKEQALLLARSYTELAILYTLHYDRAANGNCLTTINDHFGGGDGYDIEMKIQYIGNTTLLTGCESDTITSWASTAIGFDSTISLIIDTYVRYNVIDHPANQNSDLADDVKRVIHRRTLQKL